MNGFVQYGTSIAVYVLCFLLTTALAGLAQVFSQKYRSVALTPTISRSSSPNRVFWVLSLIVPLLLSAFRWQVGTDYSTYIYLYDTFAQFDSLSMFFSECLDTEPAFILLNLLVKVVFNSYLFVFAFSALLILVFFYRAMEDYHEQSAVMLMVFIFLCLLFPTTLNILRQMISVAIVFFATRYIFMRRYKKAALWFILALSFHYTSLVILPFWLIRGEKRWEKNTRIILFILISAIVVGALVLPAVFRQLPIIGMISETTSGGSKLSYGLMLLRLPILIPVIIHRKKLIEYDERNYYWIILLVFEIAISHLGYIYGVFNRLALYFAVSWVILLPALVRIMPTRSAQRCIGTYIVVITVGLWIYNVVINNYGDVLPYKSVFDAYLSGML